MSLPTPYYQSPGAEVVIYHADCLEILPLMEAGSVSAVVTDPPYLIGASSVGDSLAKSGNWPDMMNAARWYALWYEAAAKKLDDRGFLLTFGNWRSMPTYLCAFARCELQVASCMVWDKAWIGPAGPRQLRPCYELILFAAMPKARLANRSAKDICTFQWMAGNSKTTEHPAEKPVNLLAHLVRLVSKKGATVLDPFLGSGTTAVACVRLGRKCIGIEIEENYCRIAAERVEKELAQLKLGLEHGDG